MEQTSAEFFKSSSENSDWNFIHNSSHLSLIIQVSSRRRASKVSAFHVARLGLNDGAQLWISFKLFSKRFFITNIRDLHYKGLDVPSSIPLITVSWVSVLHVMGQGVTETRIE